MDSDCENDEQEIRDPHRHKGGTILQMKLVNFMCHSSFEIDFGPKVNFVIGPNGSGKSAILTALVVAFGARAAITSRGKKMSDFVKYGENSASVIIKLHNYNDITDKSAGYKPREYGTFIIIEKIIKVNDTSRLLIRSEKGKILSEKVGELKAILDHFRIQIENPVCILNQEVSKTFLHSKKPEDKYELFMKATLLEQILNDYQSSQDTFAGWKAMSDERKFSWKRLKEEKDVVSAKIEGIKKRETLVQERESLQNEYIWSGLANYQDKEREVRKTISLIEEDISNIEKDIKTKKNKIEKLDEDMKQANEGRESEREKRSGIKRSKIEISTSIHKLKEDKKLLEGDQRRKESELKSLERDKKELEDKIKQLQSQFCDEQSKENDRQVRKDKIAYFEKEIQDLKNKENSTRTQAKHLTQSLGQLRSQLGAENSKKMDENTKLGRIQSNLNRMTQGKENSLRKFGDNMIDIRREIDKAFDAKKFSKKPIGPLGHYIKLKNNEIALSLETHLKNLMYAFTFDSWEDMEMFTRIMRRSFPGAKPPQMIVRRFTKRLDVSNFLTKHIEYSTFIDLIEVENDVVFNVLTDKAFLESVLYIPDYEVAENMMMNSRLVPTNCRCAYTKDGCVMYPTPTYRSYANDGYRPTVFVENVDDQIKELEQEAKSLQIAYDNTCLRCRKLSDEHIAMKSELEEHEKLLKTIIDSIKSAELELLELKHVIDDSPVEITCFEDELTKTIDSISSIKPRIENIKTKIDALNLSIKEVENQKRELDKDDDRCERKIQMLDEQIVKSADAKKMTKDLILDSENKKKEKVNKLENDNKILKDLSLKIADIIETLDERTKPHKKPRSIDHIQKELKKTETLLEQREEYEDPEKEIMNLEERLKEIDLVEVRMSKTEENVKSFNRNLKVRKVGYNNLRKHVISKLSATFSSVMDTMSMRGELSIYVEPLLGNDKQVLKKACTLEIRVDTSYDNGSQLSQPLPLQVPSKRSRDLNRSCTQTTVNNAPNNQVLSQHMSDTRSLSGGERSFSTVAFVLALWKHCASPFKLLDEIDVFMDMVTRRISYNALINFAIMEKENTGQFIFFSPLELPKIQDSSLVKVFEMAAPHREL